MAGILVCGALSAAALAVLVVIAYSRRSFHRYAAAKTAASAAFLITAAAGFAERGGVGARGALLSACLALCFAGDVLLGLANVRAAYFGRFFAVGAASFCAAHALFCVLFASQTDVSPLHFALPAALTAALCLCARDKRRFRLRRMKLPAVVYSFFVGLMCSLGVSLGFSSPAPHGALCAVGGVLFLASDIVLLFLYFYHKKRAALRAANLITYYAGMFCLALTAWPGL